MNVLIVADRVNGKAYTDIINKNTKDKTQTYKSKTESKKTNFRTLIKNVVLTTF